GRTARRVLRIVGGSLDASGARTAKFSKTTTAGFNTDAWLALFFSGVLAAFFPAIAPSSTFTLLSPSPRQLRKSAAMLMTTPAKSSQTVLGLVNRTDWQAAMTMKSSRCTEDFLCDVLPFCRPHQNERTEVLAGAP